MRTGLGDDVAVVDVEQRDAVRHRGVVGEDAPEEAVLQERDLLAHLLGEARKRVEVVVHQRFPRDRDDLSELGDLVGLLPLAGRAVRVLAALGHLFELLRVDSP